MKRLLLSLCVVGSGIFVSGQTVPTSPVPTASRVEAQRVEKRGDSLWRFTGDVRIVTRTITITADEADARVSGPSGPTELDLRGSVHVTLNPNK
jgi:hypothetical protein